MAMIVGDRDAFQAMKPVQVMDMLLHGVCDADANGDFPLQVKQLSKHLLDQDGEEIVTAIAVTKPACMTSANTVTTPICMSPTIAEDVKVSSNMFEFVFLAFVACIFCSCILRSFVIPKPLSFRRMLTALSSDIKTCSSLSNIID